MPKIFGSPFCFWLFCALLFPSCLSAQIHVSKIFGSDIILGPNNVSAFNEAIVENHIKLLQDYIADLDVYLANEENFIQSLTAKKRLKNREKQQLQKAHNNQRVLMNEKDLLNNFILMWEHAQSKQNELYEIAAQLDQDQCVEFITKDDILFSQELELQTEQAAAPKSYKEVIPMKFVGPSTKWVKRRADRNCLSANPDDCLVWCLIEIKEGYSFMDVSFEEHSFDGCPTGFELDRTKSECYRTQGIDDDGKLSQKLSLRKIEGKEDVEVIEWRLIECN